MHAETNTCTSIVRRNWFYPEVKVRIRRGFLIAEVVSTAVKLLREYIRALVN